MTSAGRVFGAVLLMLGAASGCGQEPPAPASHQGVATYPFEKGDSLEGAAALLAGTVTVVDGCFYGLQPSGERVLPVFPAAQVERRGDGIAIRHVVYEEGDQVALGGGQRSRIFGATIPSECDTISMWTVTPE